MYGFIQWRFSGLWVVSITRSRNELEYMIVWTIPHELNDNMNNWHVATHPFDIFEHEPESSLIGLCERLPHFSITDNSHCIFDRMDEMPESSFSFKCRWKRIFIRGYFNESLFVTFSLFCKGKIQFFDVPFKLYAKLISTSILPLLPYKYHTFSPSSCFWSSNLLLIDCNHIYLTFDCQCSNCTYNKTMPNLSVSLKTKKHHHL